jgi:hypothetical protein
MEERMTSPTIENGAGGQPHDVRIAVIAVHGVADQAPKETARSVADLLLGVKQAPGGPVQYGHFVETPLRIEVRRLEPMSEAQPERAEGAQFARPDLPPESGEAGGPGTPRKGEQRQILGSQFAAHLERRGDERSRKAAAGITGTGADARETLRADEKGGAGESAAPSIDLQFTSMEIEKYEATLDSPSYDSLRLSAERIDGGVRGRTKVDIYEMYWADLSRLGSGLLRIAGELYQLFFHLSSLGRNTVDLGANANRGSRAWRTLRFLQRLCNWTLSVPIGLLNLYLPIVAVLLALGLVPETSITACAAVVWALIGVLVCGALMYRESWQPFLWWLAVQIAGLAIGWTMGSGKLLLPVHWLVSGAVLIVFALAWWLSLKYDNRRPGARVASLAIMLVLGVTLGITAPAADGTYDIARWIMWQVEFVFVALVLFWTMLICGQILTWCAGECVIWRAAPGAPADPESPRRLARRVVWTGRLGFALSASLFLIVTLSVWAAVLYAIFNEKSSGVLLSIPYVPSFELLGQGEIMLGEYANRLLNQSGGPLFNAFFVCVLLSLLMLLWAMLPSVAAEIAPPRDATRAASCKLGFWLDHGFSLARLAGSILVFGLLVVLTTGFVLKDRTSEEIRSFLEGIALGWLYPPLAGLIGESGLLTLAGLLLGGTTLGVVALGSRLGKLFVGLRPILDIALDVDNWLRENPLKHNPKSRILARYSSLLRYVGAWHDGGHGYDAVVIVAHSQGTVITADLLRFLRAQPGRWPFDEHAPVYLLTMGCPLRQLYGLRFPHLYGWARYRLPQPSTPLTQREMPIPDTRQPLPHELGVALWVNAYRSGDYVGRRLWIRDDDPARWNPATREGGEVTSDAPGQTGVDVSKATRIEFCIASGAHTHYFDETAGRVGHAIDQLIAIAASGKQSYGNGYPVFF